MMYNPNRMMGLSALSPTVSAEQQYVQKQKIPPANIDPILMDLIANKQQLDNAAKAQQQMQQQPPNPPTIAQQYNAAAAQQANQLRQQMAARAQQAQMARGLGGMPVGNVGNEQAYARGGIVAFNDGGGVKRFALGGLTDTEETEYNDLSSRMSHYNSLIDAGLLDTSDPTFTAVQSRLDYLDHKKSSPHGVAPGKYAIPAPIKPTTQPAAPAQPAASTAAPAASAGNIFAPTGPTRPFGLDVPLPDVAPSSAAPPAPPAPTKAPTKSAAPATSSKDEDEGEDDFRTQQMQSIKSLQDQLTEAMKPENAPSLEKIRADQDAAAKAGGYGKYSKAAQQTEDFMKQAQARSSGDYTRAVGTSLIELGAKIGTSRNRNPLVAALSAVSETTPDFMKQLNALRDSEDKLKMQAIQLQEKREQAMQSDDEKLQVQYLNLKEKHDNDIYRTQTRLEGILGTVQAHADAVDAKRAQMTLSSQQFAERMAELQREHEASNALRQQQLDQLNAVRTQQLANTQLGQLTKSRDALRSRLLSSGISMNAADRGRAQAQLNNLDKQIEQLQAKAGIALAPSTVPSYTNEGWNTSSSGGTASTIPWTP